MKQLFAAIKRSPKRTAALLTLAAALIVPASMFAWGPASRPTYTTQSPAPHVTFNSMTNNPAHGNELNFVQIKEAGASSSTYTEEIALQPGKEYEVYVYYHNNAAANLNASGKGVALDTTMRVQMPSKVLAGEKARITGIVSASNAQPKEVWDEAYGTSAEAVALRYVQGSAKIHSKGAVDGKTLADSLVSTGVKLGYNELNGTLPGCHEYAGYVTFRFKVDQPNLKVVKQVSKAGEGKFSKSINAKPGEKVDFRISYLNNGTTQQNNVVVKDTLPKGLSYVAGSTYLANSTTNGYAKVSDENLTKSSGINIGNYAPNGTAYVKFTAQVNKDELECGINKLTNTASVTTINGGRTDTAEVVVEKICKEEPKPKKIEVCELDTSKIIKIDENKFDSKKHSKDLSDSDNPVKPGKIKVCEVDSGKIIRINEDNFNADEHSKDLSKCDAPVTPEKPKPEVPTELPQTGLSETIMGVIGLASLAATSGYYFTSRKRAGSIN